MPNRRNRRAKRDTHDAASGLAALLVLAGLANATASPPVYSEPELEREAQRVAAQLIALTGDEEGQYQILANVSDRVPNAVELVTVLRWTLRIITATYVGALLDRTDELEAGHPDTTRQALVQEALAALNRIADAQTAS